MGTLGIILAIIGAITGAVGIGVSADQANKTRQSNADINSQNIEQADKSYERSKPSAQVRDLVAAGLTEEQARNVVASRGSAAVYTPPSLTPTESGVDLSGVLSGLSGMGSSFSQLGQFAMDDRQRDNGGFIGSYLAEKPIAVITDHLGELPIDASTLSGFMEYASASDAPKWCKDLLGSSPWKDCVRNIQGNRALRSFFTETSQIASTDLSLAGARLDNQQKGIQILLGEEQYTQEQLNTTALQLQTQFSLDTMPLVTQSKITELKGQIARFETDERLWTDDAYKTAYLASMLQDQENQLLMAQCMHAIYTQEKSWLNDPDHAALVGVYSALNKVGLTSTSVGAVFAVAEASGIPIAEGVRKLFEPASGGLLGILEDSGELVGNVVDGVRGIPGMLYNVGSQVNDRALMANAKAVCKYLIDKLPTGEIKSVSDIVDKIYHEPE